MVRIYAHTTLKSTMRVVALADLHLHPYRLCSRDGGRDRLQDGLSALRQSLDYARTLGCPWVFCGDLKMPKLLWPQEALTGALALFRAYPDVPKLMLPGNHDGNCYQLGGSGLAPFAGDARVVETPEVVTLLGESIAVAPVQPLVTSEFLAEARRAGVTALFGHAFVRGVLLGPDEVRLPTVGLTLQELGVGEVFRVVVLGDVHKGQGWRPGRGWRPWKDWVSETTLSPPCRPRSRGKTFVLSLGSPHSKGFLRGSGEWEGEVFYPGSPYPQSWGESEDGPKGALLVDLKTGEVSLLPIQAPQFLRVTLSEAEALEVLDPREWEGHFVRVTLVGRWAVAARVSRRLEELRAQGSPRSFQVVVQGSNESSEVRCAALHAGLPLGDLLQQYLEVRPFSSDEVSSRTVLEAGRRLMGAGDE